MKALSVCALISLLTRNSTCLSGMFSQHLSNEYTLIALSQFTQHYALLTLGSNDILFVDTFSTLLISSWLLYYVEVVFAEYLFRWKCCGENFFSFAVKEDSPTLVTQVDISAFSYRAWGVNALLWVFILTHSVFFFFFSNVFSSLQKI